jgi:nitrate reductase cytochrome c-type subunit
MGTWQMQETKAKFSELVKLDDIMASMSKKRRSDIENRAMELTTLKDLRHASEKTQEELVAKFPNRPPVVIEHLGMEALSNKSI